MRVPRGVADSHRQMAPVLRAMLLHSIFQAGGCGLHGQSLSYQCLQALQPGCPPLCASCLTKSRRINKPMSAQSRYLVIVAAANTPVDFMPCFGAGIRSSVTALATTSSSLASVLPRKRTLAVQLRVFSANLIDICVVCTRWLCF